MGAGCPPYEQAVLAPRRATGRRLPGGAHLSGAPAAQQPLEHRILLTATMCLLAFGAVMVYSASSATTLLQGEGNGSSYLIRFVVYGGVGLVVMRVLARDGVAKVTSHHRAAAGDLVRAGGRFARAPHRCLDQRRKTLDRAEPAPVPALRADEARTGALLRDAARQPPGAGDGHEGPGQTAADGRRGCLPVDLHQARPGHDAGDRLHGRGDACRGGDPAAASSA